MSLYDVLIKIGGDTSKYERSMNDLKLTHKKTTQYIESGWKSVTQNITKMLALVGAGYGVKSIAQSFWDVGVSADKVQKSLAAATGSIEEAAEAEAFLWKESERLGLVFESQISDYQKLAASAKGTKLQGEAAKEIYLGIAEASTALQLSADETSGAINAVSQMISKGKVQAEELRGQLGERLPGAFQIAAQAMGTTTAGLSEMLDRGELISDDFLPKFAKALRERFAGDIESASSSAQASINRMANSWYDLRKTVMESGVTEAVAEGIDDVNEGLKTWIANNEDLIKQKVPEYIASVNDKIQLLADIHSNLPAGALEYGLIAAILGKSSTIGAMAVALTVLNEQLKNVGMNIGQLSPSNLKKFWDELSVPSQNILDVIFGKRDWNTGEWLDVAKGSYRGKIDFNAARDLTVRKKTAGAAEAVKSYGVISSQEYPFDLNSIYPSMEADFDLSEVQSAYEKRVALKKNLTDRMKRLTLSELDYNLWALEQEEREARDTALDDEDLQQQITETFKLSRDKMVLDNEEAMRKIKAETDKTFGEEMQSAMAGWASNFSSDLNDMLWDSDTTFKDIARSFGQMLTQMVIQKEIADPMLEWASEGKNWKAAFAAVGSWFSGGGGTAASAHGNVFAGPGISAYENRIVGRPTLFPFAHGVGLMGEAGYEGVLPLTKTRSGNLGVEFEGGGVVYENHFHITGNWVGDERAMTQLVTRISTSVAEKVAPGAVVRDYQRDGVTRRGLRG